MILDESEITLMVDDLLERSSIPVKKVAATAGSIVHVRLLPVRLTACL
jgi:hypothetical protein